MSKKPNAASILTNNLPRLNVLMARMTNKELLVGVPQAEDRREDGELSNATLAYIHDNGAPAAGIPTRPFMRPGIERSRQRVADLFAAGARAVLQGREHDPEVAMHRAGLVAVAGIKAVIGAGLTPALKPGTIAGRARSRGTKSRRAGEAQYLAAVGAGVSAEEAQTAAGIKPLINTGQLRNSITYIVRKKS